MGGDNNINMKDETEVDRVDRVIEETQQLLLGAHITDQNISHLSPSRDSAVADEKKDEKPALKGILRQGKNLSGGMQKPKADSTEQKQKKTKEEKDSRVQWNGMIVERSNPVPDVEDSTSRAMTGEKISTSVGSDSKKRNTGSGNRTVTDRGKGDGSANNAENVVRSTQNSAPASAKMSKQNYLKLSELISKTQALDQEMSSNEKSYQNGEQVEVDLSFLCMSPADYEQSLADKGAKNHSLSSDFNLDADENTDLSNQNLQSQDPVPGFNNLEERNANQDYDDDDCNFLFSDDPDEPALPAPEPKPFIKLWTALTTWITPESVHIVLQWNKDDSDTVSSPHELSLPLPDRSDIEASRYRALMSIINLHTPRCLNELNLSDMRRMADHRLSQLISQFDFSQPMPKLDDKLWRSMTLVLLAIVFNSMKQIDVDENMMMSSFVKDLGLSSYEYRYLVRSAIPSLSKGSA